MATERRVVVRLDVIAGGNAATVLRANADAAAKLNTAVGRGGRAIPTTEAGFLARAQQRHGMREGMQDAQNVVRLGETAGAVANFKDKLEEFGVVRTSMIALAAATGAVAAASPAAFETLFGSVKLLAGEFGIMLIPAVVTISEHLQAAARTVRALDEATGGAVGKLVTVGVIGAIVVVVGTKIVGMGLSAVAATRALFGLKVAADAAAASQGKNAIGGGLPGGAGGGTGGGIGGTIGRIGSAVAAVTIVRQIMEAVEDAAGHSTWGEEIGKTFGGGDSVAAARAKISMNFQGGSSGLLEARDAMQTDMIRDPMQQAQFETNQRALEILISRVEQLTHETQLNRPPSPNEANQ